MHLNHYQALTVEHNLLFCVEMSVLDIELLSSFMFKKTRRLRSVTTPKLVPCGHVMYQTHISSRTCLLPFLLVFYLCKGRFLQMSQTFHSLLCYREENFMVLMASLPAGCQPHLLQSGELTVLDLIQDMAPSG